MGSIPSTNPDPVSTDRAAVRPGIIVVEPASAGLRVAALSTLDRLLVAAHRAGLAPLTVVSGHPLPPVPRARAWRVPFTVVREVAGTPDRGVWLRTDVLVQPVDLKRLAQAGSAQLVDGAGTRLSAVSTRRATDPARVFEIGGDGGCTLLTPEGVACAVRNAGEARDATRRLWASITSSADGWVDRVFNRPAGRPLSRLLVHTPVTPNQISVVATLLGVVAAVLFASGQYAPSIVAAVLFQVSAILDCMDGDVARVALKESRLGKWLDIVGDQVVHIGVFIGVTTGVVRSGGTAAMGWLGALAVVGAAMSFWMVLRGMKRPETRGSWLQQVLNAATNRDFSVLVLALAVAGRLDWFLWMAGVGSHVFWLLLWWLLRDGQAPVAAREADSSGVSTPPRPWRPSDDAPPSAVPSPERRGVR